MAEHLKLLAVLIGPKVGNCDGRLSFTTRPEPRQLRGVIGRNLPVFNSRAFLAHRARHDKVRDVTNRRDVLRRLKIAVDDNPVVDGETRSVEPREIERGSPPVTK